MTERRTRRSFFRFHDGRVVAIKGNYPHTTVLYDGPERRAQSGRLEVEAWQSWPNGLFGIGAKNDA